MHTKTKDFKRTVFLKNKYKIIFIFNYGCTVLVCLCMGLHIVHTDAYRGQKRVLDPPELELHPGG